MRVIAGEKRGMILYEPKDYRIRPTSDKVKGAVFSSIQQELDEHSVFGDLFGGSGAMSVEALSRGAKQAVIFDRDKDSIALIKKNLQKAGFEDRAVVMRTTAKDGIIQTAARGIQCDLIFMDPPYADGVQTIELLSLIGEKNFLKSGGIIMIEHDKSVIIPDSAGVFFQFKEKKYGSTMITYYREAENE